MAAVLKIASGRLSDRLSRRKPIVVAGYALSSARPPARRARHAARARPRGARDRPHRQGRPQRAPRRPRRARDTRGRPRAGLRLPAGDGPRGRDDRSSSGFGHPVVASREPPARVRARGGARRPRGGDARVRGPRRANGARGRAERGRPGDRRPPRAGPLALPRCALPLHPRQLLGRVPAPAGAGRRGAAGGDPARVDAPPPREGRGQHLGRLSLRSYRAPPRDRDRLDRVRAGLRRLRRGRLGRSASSALFAFYGLFHAFSEGAERALVADLAGASSRGRAFGLFHAATGAALLPASLLTGVLWQRFGAPVALGTGAAFAAFAALGLFLLVPETAGNRRPAAS